MEVRSRTYPGDNRHSVVYTGPQAFESPMNVKSYRVRATYVDKLWPDASGVGGVVRCPAVSEFVTSR